VRRKGKMEGIKNIMNKCKTPKGKKGEEEGRQDTCKNKGTNKEESRRRRKKKVIVE